MAPGEAFRTEGSHLFSDPGGKSALLVPSGRPFPQPLSPTFPNTSPGPPARRDPQRGPAAWGKVGAASARGRSLLLLLAAIPEPLAAASRTRVSRLESQAARLGAPRPPAGRARAEEPSRTLLAREPRGPGSTPSPLQGSPSRPGRRRCPAPSAPVSAGQPRARAASVGPSGAEVAEGRAGRRGREPGAEAGAAPPRAPRSLPPETSRQPPGRTSGSPCPGGKSLPPRQRGQQRGRRGGWRAGGGSRAEKRPGSASEREDRRRRGA